MKKVLPFKTNAGKESWHDWHQLLGWTGMILLILTYAYLSRGILLPKSTAYQLLNFCGAMSVGVSAVARRAWPVVVLEFIWALIALFFLLK